MHELTSDQRFRLVADHASDHAIIVLDADGVIVEWSPGAERLLGWSALEAIDQSAAMFFTREDRQADAPRTELNTALALGRASDVRWHVRKDGSSVFCDGTVSRILAEDGKTVLGFGKIMREAYSFGKKDASAQGTATSEQRSFLAAVLESVDDGIVACDRQGKLTFFNEAARQIHGMEQMLLEPAGWAQRYQLYRADGETRLPLEEVPLYRALMGERVVAAEVVVLAENGRRLRVEVSGRPLCDSAGAILGAVISMHDVSGRHDAQTALDAAVFEQGKRRVAEASEERLRQAEEQLRLATEAARLGIWTWDAERERGTLENEQIYRIFDIPADLPDGDRAWRLVETLHPDDAAGFRQALHACVSEDKRLHFVGRLQTRQANAVRWVELTGVPGAVHAGVIIGTAADITERKELDAALETARLRLAATLAAGEVATWLWDIVGDRIVGDANLSKLFGLPEALIGGAPLATYLEPIHPDDRAQVARQIALATETREAYRATYRIRRTADDVRWVNARARIEFDQSGTALFMAGVLMDITSQKQAEDALRLAEERYRTLIASMDEAFAIVQVLVDADGRPHDYRFEEVNRAFEEQSGLANAAGKTIREMVPGIEARWIELYGRVALQREPARFTEYSAAMGYWWDVYATPMGEPGERRLAILFSDVTVKRRAEENLRQLTADLSETNRRKTEFLATLAHELRNPLAPMRTGVDLLRISGKNMQTSDRVLQMLDRQLRQMAHLIDDLMDVSRINSGKIALKNERIDLRDAIGNAVETALPAIESAHHRLSLGLPAYPVMVDADAARLAQVLGNLLTNAVKYTPAGGEIRLSVRRAAASAIITVADTGIGIPLEAQGQVFDMFSQVSRNMGRAQGGLGIGLSLVRSLVELHGGTITVASAGPGEGSMFTIALPSAPDAAPGMPVAGARGEAPADRPERGLHIVVADDHVDAASMLGSVLMAIGHRVETVHDGLAAVQKILSAKPELAIVDIGMPGLTGYEVARQIRARPEMAGTALVALTGWGGELDRHRSDEAGFDAHLTKPAGLDALTSLIESLRKRGD